MEYPYSTEFVSRLIRGKAVECIFEQMFRESGKFTVIPFGYEVTVPEIAQYQYQLKEPRVLDTIRNSPDFILITENRDQDYFVEVKYLDTRNNQDIEKIADSLVKRWNPSYLFIASPDGFFFESAHIIVSLKGKITPLQDNWISALLRKKYLDILNHFLRQKDDY